MRLTVRDSVPITSHSVVHHSFHVKTSATFRFSSPVAAVRRAVVRPGGAVAASVGPGLLSVEPVLLTLAMPVDSLTLLVAGAVAGEAGVDE